MSSTPQTSHTGYHVTSLHKLLGTHCKLVREMSTFNMGFYKCILVSSIQGTFILNCKSVLNIEVSSFQGCFKLNWVPTKVS